MILMHPNILCVSGSVSTWVSRIGLVWCTLVPIMIYLFCLLSCFYKSPIRQIWPFMCGTLLWILFTFCPLLILSLTEENWTLISQENSTNMYQYFNGQAFPVILAMDGNYTQDPNSTCTYIKIDRLCNWPSPIPQSLSSVPGVLRCRTNSQEGLELHSSYMSSISSYSHTSVNLGFLASSLVLLAFTIIMYQRFSRSYEFQSAELDEFQSAELDEKSYLLT